MSRLLKWPEVESAFTERYATQPPAPPSELVRQCESPIEKSLAGALEEILGGYFRPGTVEIIPQFKLGRFRYDFAIMLIGSTFYGTRPVFLIECDGKEFHGPGQLENDLAKDAAALEIGAYCLRYRGSDIHRNPYALAAEIARAVEHMRRWAFQHERACAS